MPAVSCSRSQRPLPPPSHLTEHHFLGDLPSSLAGKKKQTDCTVCSKKKGRGRKTTTYICKQCQLPMCITSCFELYHTKVDPHNSTCKVTSLFPLSAPTPFTFVSQLQHHPHLSHHTVPSERNQGLCQISIVCGN